MSACAIGDEIVAGAVVNPTSGEVWTARRGHGAWLDGRPIHVNEPPPLAMALVATGFGYDSERRGRQAQVLTSVLPKIRDMRRFGCASIDLCALACGRVDGYYEQGLKPWDLAAGGLIATEAGAWWAGSRAVRRGSRWWSLPRPGLFEQLEGLLRGLDADREPAGRRSARRRDACLVSRRCQATRRSQRLDLAEAHLDQVVVPFSTRASRERPTGSFHAGFDLLLWNSLKATALSSRVHARRQSGREMATGGTRPTWGLPQCYPSRPPTGNQLPDITESDRGRRG